MPASRRATQSARRGAQSTLSFGSRGARVTKPTLPIHPAKKAALSSQEEITESAPPAAEAEPQPTTAEVVIQDEAVEELQKVARSREEELASKITDAQLKRYWKAREAERKAPRVHQQDLTMSEKILRHFDLSSQYGPCVGIARLKRWNRANRLNLHPPLEVLAVLLKEEEKGNVKSERAHIDALISSRFMTE